VQLSLPSYGHSKTDIERGIAKRERVVQTLRGGKMGDNMGICNVRK
jgi:hypothetical protein